MADALDWLLRVGADETELVLTAVEHFSTPVRQQSLAQLLDSRIYYFDCPPEEKERARTLLARAPDETGLGAAWDGWRCSAREKLWKLHTYV